MRLLVPIAVVLLLVSAGPPPADLVRAGNAAFRAGRVEEAGSYYAAAAEHTPDPGLVAFNRAAAAFAAGDLREAELGYARCLADAAIPADRRTKARFNRGVCIVGRATDAAALADAVRCFEQVLDDDPPDPAFAADARHNLELAKLLWAAARAKKAIRPDIGEDAAPDPPPPAGTPDPAESPGDPGTGRDAKPEPGGKAKPTPNAAGAEKTPAGRSQTPGAGTLPVLRDDSAPQELSPDDTRAHLVRVADRLDRERSSAARLRAGPERPNVRDW